MNDFGDLYSLTIVECVWFWRCSEQASLKPATLPGGQFWAEGSQDCVGTKEVFESP